MSLTKLSLGGNNDVIHNLFPPRESLVNDIPAGDGNIEKLFIQCVNIYFEDLSNIINPFCMCTDSIQIQFLIGLK